MLEGPAVGMTKRVTNAGGLSAIRCGELRRGDLDGDLPAEPGPCGQAEIIPAPEPPRVIPVRRPPGRKQARPRIRSTTNPYWTQENTDDRTTR